MRVRGSPVSRLLAALAGLPDASLIPVGWVRSLVDTEPPVPVDAPELAVAAFARLVGRSAATVRSWCERGLVPGAYKLPGDRRRAAWRIPAASVVAFRQRNSSPELVVTAGAAAPDITAWRRVGRARRGKR